MNKIKSYLTIILLILTGVSCSKEERNESDSNAILKFGWFASSTCSGDCGQIYKMKDGKMFRDIDYNQIEGDVFVGNFQEMENVDYKNYVELFNLPSEIYNEPNGYLECSGCLEVDSGGFYIEYESSTMHKSWRFRNAQYPTYIESYRSLLLSKIEELNSF
ncbi:hypothetical protein WJN01_01425 [Flavobacteriaceae bacterium SZ-1-7]|uniref:hypothetical protein n=1 Tax=Tamlana sedimenti TaxID=3134126 RepID=UPI003121A3EB